MGFVLLNMGYLEVMAGRYPDAERHFAESLEHYRSDEEARGLAHVLSAMGALCNVVGRWDEARVYLASRLSPAAVKTIRQRSGELSPKLVLAQLRAPQ